jgi:hypothetical protein
MLKQRVRKTTLGSHFIDFEINEHEQDFTEFLQNDLATLNELNIDRNRKNVYKVKSRSGNNLLDTRADPETQL